MLYILFKLQINYLFIFAIVYNNKMDDANHVIFK